MVTASILESTGHSAGGLSGTAPATMPAKPIVVGADSSYLGRAALWWAAGHAWLVGSDLEVYLQDSKNRVDRYPPVIAPSTRAFPLLPMHVHACPDPVARLVAASRKAQLLVIGFRERPAGGGIQRRVAMRAACDVLVIRGRPVAMRGGNRQVTALLGTGDDETVVRGAVRLAESRGVPLRLCRALPRTTVPSQRAVGRPAGRPVTRTMGHPAECSLEGEVAALDAAAELADRLAPQLRVVADLVRSSTSELIDSTEDTDVLVIAAGTAPDRTQLDLTQLDLTHPIRTAVDRALCPVLVTRRPVLDAGRR